MGYCTFDDVKARLRAELNRWDDTHVEQIIEAVSTRIEQETARVFVASSSETRVFEASRDGFCTVDDLLTLTSISWTGGTLTADDYRVKRNRLSADLSIWAFQGGPWSELDEVTVVGTWGFTSTCPPDIWDTCVVWSTRAMKEADAGLQDATAIPELGQLVYAKAVPANVRRVLNRYALVTPVRRVA